MTIDSEVRSLRGISMFRNVDASKLKLLAFTAERMAYAPGDTLFRQNDESEAAFVVLEGEVDVLLEGEARFRVARLGAGALVGEIGILCDVSRTATVEAHTHVVALRIMRDVFFDMLNEFPQMSVAVMRDLAHRLEATNAQLVAAKS